MADGKPQAGTYPWRLGREKGVVYPVYDRVRDSRAVVDKGYLQVKGSVCFFLGPMNQEVFPWVRLGVLLIQSVAGVVDDIQKDPGENLWSG